MFDRMENWGWGKQQKGVKVVREIGGSDWESVLSQGLLKPVKPSTWDEIMRKGEKVIKKNN